MNLTDQQIRHFMAFGYLGIPGAFSGEEIAWISDEFEKAIAGAGGSGHDGTQRTMFGAPIEHSEKFLSLLDHPRIVGLLSGILGDDFNYCGGDGNYYTGDTGWHPDGSWGQLVAVKIAFYLDPVGKDTGCLRVIPGSHDPSHIVWRTAGDSKNSHNPNHAMEMFGVAPKDYPGNVALETRPGDLLIFNHNTWHSAWGGGKRRRMFTMNCTKNAHSPHDLALLKKYIAIHSAGANKVDTGGGMFLPLTVDTATPARWQRLRQAADLHDELFPQYAGYRKRIAVK